VVDRQPKDEQFNLAVLSWLNEYFVALTKTGGNGSEKSVVETLKFGAERLSIANGLQREVSCKLVDLVNAHTKEMAQIENGHKAMEMMIPLLQEMITFMRQSTQAALRRATNAEASMASESEKQLLKRFAGFRREYRDLKARVEECQAALSDKWMLHSLEAELEPTEGLDTENELSGDGARELYIKERNTEQMLNSIRSTIDNAYLRMHKIHALPKVFFVASGEIHDADSQAEWERIVATDEPFQVFVQEDLLRIAIQARVQMDLYKNSDHQFSVELIGEIPTGIPGESPIRVVHLPPDVKISRPMQN
jgi:hypothetical protein